MTQRATAVLMLAVLMAVCSGITNPGDAVPIVASPYAVRPALRAMRLCGNVGGC